MALVRIDTPEGIDEDKAKKISSITNNLMVSILSIPPQENYVIRQRHNVNYLLHHPEETSTDSLNEIVFIQITLNQGRTEALKTNFLNTLVNELNAQLGLNSKHIYINLTEVSSENWYFGKGNA